MSGHVEELLARRSELTPAEEARLEEHLQGCPQCRQTAAAYAQQSAMLRALPLVAPPPALRAGVLAGIREQPKRRWGLRPLFALAPLAAAAVIVLAALTYFNRPQTSNHTALPGALPTTAPAVLAPTSPAPPKKRASTVKHPTRVQRQSGQGHQTSATQSEAPPTQAPPVVAQYYPTSVPQSAAPPPTASVQAPVPTSHRPLPSAASHPHPTASSAPSVASGPTAGAPLPPVPPSTGGGSGGKQHPTPTSPPKSTPRPTPVIVAPVYTPPPASPPPTPSAGTSPSAPVVMAPTPSPVPTPTP